MFVCSVCKETKPVKTEGGTGYGYEGESLICYECCGIRDRASMMHDGRACLYFVPEKGASYNKCHVTNWPNTLSFVGSYSVGRHNMAGRRYDIQFTGPDGYLWHGVTYGDYTQVCHCRRTKKAA